MTAEVPVGEPIEREDDMRLIDFRGAVILGKNDVFFLSGVTATTYYSTVFGHFDEE